MIIGIDHGYYAMKTPHVCFPTGLSKYDYEPYTMQNVLQYAGNYYVCGTGRQTLMKDKTANDNYYLLTMAALAQEIEYRRAERKGKSFSQPDCRLQVLEGKRRLSGSICSGRSSHFVSNTKMNHMN